MKCAFFDLDNTLTDRTSTVGLYAEYFLYEFQQYLAEHVSVQYLATTFNELDRGGYETHDIRSAAIRNLAIWRKPVSAQDLSRHWQDWVPNHSLPMNGLNECLEELISMGFKLCLVTNGQSKNQRDKIKRLSLDKYFDTIVISEEFGVKKPDARIFKFALDQMACHANDAFFIGDHPVNDYLGSTAMGFTAIWLEGAHPWPKDIDKPLSINSLHELCPLVRNLIAKA